MPRVRLAPWCLLVAALVFPGCSSPMPMATVEHVDLPRFMGDWYVLAHVPAGIERDAHDAVETYALEADGSIATTYRFRRGADGPVKTLHPRGFVHDDETNAEWRMQFIWPFRAEYLVVYLDEAYTKTIIGRSKRDMAWIMARTPTIPADELDRLVDELVALGYDRERVRLVPHAPVPADEG